MWRFDPSASKWQQVVSVGTSVLRRTDQLDTPKMVSLFIIIIVIIWVSSFVFAKIEMSFFHEFKSSNRVVTSQTMTLLPNSLALLSTQYIFTKNSSGNNTSQSHS